MTTCRRFREVCPACMGDIPTVLPRYTLVMEAIIPCLMACLPRSLRRALRARGHPVNETDTVFQRCCFGLVSVPGMKPDLASGASRNQNASSGTG